MLSPSGEQFEIAFEDQRAVVVEVGGGLRTYSVNGREVIDGYGIDEMPSAGRGQVLIPWPNRLQDGSYEFAGRRHQLPLTEPRNSNAIHGLVRWAAWTVREREAHRVLLDHRIHPQPGYPFVVQLGIEYALGVDGLSVRTTATNLGPDPCPYGAGAHPYLRPGTKTVDSAILRLPARTVLEADAGGIPVGSSSVSGTAYDFREARPVGETKLDHCFADLELDSDGRMRVRLTSPDDAIGVSLWAEDAYRYVMVYTGDSHPDVDRRSVAVEPMTCPPNAFRSGEALVVLETGDAFTASWGIAPE